MAQRRLMLVHPPFYRLFTDRFSYARYPLSLGYLAGAVKSGTDSLGTITTSRSIIIRVWTAFA